jgi:DNA-binding MarR family transcriptional regulator
VSRRGQQEGPEDKDRPISEVIGPLLRDTFRAMLDGLETVFSDSELILSQWLVLKLIGAGDIRCVGDAHRETGIEHGATTRLISTLERRGLVHRNYSAKDRRVVELSLSDSGLFLVSKMKPRLTSFWDEKLHEFSREDEAKLLTLLEKLRDSLTRESA